MMVEMKLPYWVLFKGGEPRRRGRVWCVQLGVRGARMAEGDQEL